MYYCLVSTKIMECHYYINILIYTYCNTDMYIKQSLTPVILQNISSDFESVTAV